MNNLHILTAEFETLVMVHNGEKRKLHESILLLRQECRKQAHMLEEQVSLNADHTQGGRVPTCVRACVRVGLLTCAQAYVVRVCV
jgi:hypothetical protein